MCVRTAGTKTNPRKHVYSSWFGKLMLRKLGAIMGLAFEAWNTEELVISFLVEQYRVVTRGT